MVNRQTLSKIGIGGWGIGGFAQKDPNNNDSQQIDALAYQFDKGLNFVEVNFWNSEGQSAELIKQGLMKSSRSRDDIFIEQAIYNYNLPTIKEVNDEFEKCLKTFDTDYIDTLLFPMSSFVQYGFDELVELTQSYLSSGKIHYTSVTNFNLEDLKRHHKIFGDKLFSHELHFSFEIRVNEESGITDYADKNDILNLPYQPLRRNRTALQNWPLLVELAEKYEKTQNQIILNWMIHRGMHPLVKSTSIEHIDDNLGSFEFEMESSDYQELNDFKVPHWTTPDIDWSRTIKGATYVDQLPNIFDDEYQSQEK